MADEYAAWRPHFASALDPRFYTIEYLDQLLIEGRAAFFANSKAAIVAEIKVYPTGMLVVAGVIAAGDKGTIMKVLIPHAEAWGRAQGCSFAMIESRPGWGRDLKKDGYEAFQLSIVKEL